MAHDSSLPTGLKMHRRQHSYTLTSVDLLGWVVVVYTLNDNRHLFLLNGTYAVASAQRQSCADLRPRPEDTPSLSKQARWVRGLQ